MGDYMDLREMQAVAIVAEELNMRRAAERLHISQPPLSRKINAIEERLGIRLFIRHSRGLELTPAGGEVLGIISPLLVMQEDAQRKLKSLAKPACTVIGLTTAFEQGIYGPFMQKMTELCRPIFKRASSIQLANGVAKGDILAAVVALPLAAKGFSVMAMQYAEPMLAFVPDCWSPPSVLANLHDYNDRPFFWPCAARNPDCHQWMRGVFKMAAFSPTMLEEPEEHDVLLARIAAGEAFAIMPKSFAAIRRAGISCLPVGDLPPLAMGMIYRDVAGEELARRCSHIWRRDW